MHCQSGLQSFHGMVTQFHNERNWQSLLIKAAFGMKTASMSITPLKLPQEHNTRNSGSQHPNQASPEQEKNREDPEHPVRSRRPSCSWTSDLVQIDRHDHLHGREHDRDTGKDDDERRQHLLDIRGEGEVRQMVEPSRPRGLRSCHAEKPVESRDPELAVVVALRHFLVLDVEIWPDEGYPCGVVQLGRYQVVQLCYGQV